MYYIKILAKDIFNELFVIVLFSMLLVYSWFLSIGLVTASLSSLDVISMQRELARENLNYLVIEDLPLKGLNTSNNLPRNEIFDFSQTLDNSGVIMSYDAMESR